MARTRFVLVSHMRTGSTVPSDLLKHHPDIYSAGETLWQRPVDPHRHLEDRIAKHRQPVYGFMLKLGQINDASQPFSHRFVKELYDSGWTIIYLRRLNFVHHAVSIELARLRGYVFHDTTTSTHPPPPASIRIDVNRILKIIQAIEVSGIVYEHIMKPLTHLSLIYERDLLFPEQHQATASRVFAVLNLPDAPVETSFRKIVPLSLPGFIENYGELAAALGETRYSRYLNDDVEV